MRTFLAGVGTLVIVVGLVVGYYQVLPWFYGQQFKATRASNPYVTTQQTSLVQLYAAYQKLEADKARYPENAVAISGQQQVIVLQMKQQAALIPGNVPPQIAAFLETH